MLFLVLNNNHNHICIDKSVEHVCACCKFEKRETTKMVINVLIIKYSDPFIANIIF